MSLNYDQAREIMERPAKFEGLLADLQADIEFYTEQALE